MTVFWTDRAFDLLLQIREYLTLTSEVYAERAVERLVARSEQLGAFPTSGQRVPEYGRDDVREVIEAPDRVLYRIGPSRLDVLAVVHGHRALPAEVDDL